MEQITQSHVCKDGRLHGGIHVSGADLPRLLLGVEKTAGFAGKCFYRERIMIDDLSGASFFGADLQDTEWKFGINLQNADFRKADLSGAKMSGAKLNRANFSQANLTNAWLMDADLSNVDMMNCRLVGVNFEEAILNHTLMESSDFGGKIVQDREKDYKAALKIYRALKSNFRDIEEYDSVSWAYYHEREMQRKMIFPQNVAQYHPPRESDLKNRFTKAQYVGKYFLRYVIATVQSWSSGYGQKPLRAFLVAFIMIPIFAILYFLTNGLEATHPLTPVDYFLFSVSTVLKSDTGGVQPTSNLAQLLASIEAAIGLSLFAIFANALGQRAGKD
jgi:uncharacterized protein YjbI with pentapeptide repeats